MLPLAVLPLGLFLLNLFFTNPAPDDTFRDVLIFTVRERALARAAALGLRSLALIGLSVGYLLTTDPQDLVNALMQQVHLSPRIGYSLYVAWNTIPFLREDLRRIEAAHRIRLRGRRRRIGEALPVAITLLTGAIRHAERASLSMLARGLESEGKRTYLVTMPWRAVDTIYVVVFSVASAGVFVLLIHLDLFILGLG
jgi:energy-coupling factor transport system permease protein